MAGNTSEYTARTYKQGDEAALVTLFNIEQADLVGFTPRTVEYWRWCCLKRPDVNEKSILIVEKENKTVGYVVVGKSGNIWELCYDSFHDAKTIVSILLTWAVDYAMRVGSNSVILNAYVEDQLVREVCKDMDFAESLPEPMFLSVLDLPQLIREVLQTKSQSMDKNEVFWFSLKNCPPWCVSSFGVRLEGEQVTILQEPGLVSKITIETEMSTLVALIFGKEDLMTDILASKLHFYPFWKIFEVRNLFTLLQTKMPWFNPRADIA